MQKHWVPFLYEYGLIVDNCVGVSFWDVYSRYVAAVPQIGCNCRNIQPGGDKSGSVAVSEAVNVAEPKAVLLTELFEPVIRRCRKYRLLTTYT